MKKPNFLIKLKEEKSLKLVEPSEEISEAYLIKNEKCIRVARLAFEAGIYENAISEAYYSVYNTVMSLFYKCGIKCENHSAAVFLIKELFNLKELYDIFSDFKKERIDNQYYLPVVDAEPVTKKRCGEMIKLAQRFNIELRVYMTKITIKDINEIRKNFEKI